MEPSFSSELSQHSAALDVLQRMKAYARGIRPAGQQEKEGLSCDEIAMMLDYAQKTNGQSLGVNMSRLRILALRVRGDICDDNFARLGAVKYIDKAIIYKRWAILLTPSGDKNKPRRLMALMLSYYARFERFGEISDIHRAIAYQSQAVGLTPEVNAAKPTRLSNLGNAYFRRYELLARVVDVDMAIACHTRAIKLASEGDPDRPGLLNNLGVAYYARFKWLGKLSDVDQAIVWLTQAVGLAPDGDVDKVDWLINLRESYWKRFERLQNLSDIDKAIACSTQVVELTPEGDAAKPCRIECVGKMYKNRFERLGEIVDIEKAITWYALAVDAAPDNHTCRPSCLTALGDSYLDRFETLGEFPDVEKSMACHTQALELSPNGHSCRAAGLGNLGNSYLERFDRFGEISDLDKSIDCQTRAMELTPEGHAKNPFLLSNLGASYMRRFERLGAPADITKAIACQNQVVELIPNGDNRRPGCLNNLGAAYHARFVSFGELSDIDKAVSCQTQAVELTPEGHPRKPDCLRNLGMSYEHRFERLGELSDIDKAISCQTQAVELTPDGNMAKPGRLNHLGNAYRTRFEGLGELHDIENAIACHIRAVQLAPDGHPDMPTWTNSIGNSYRRRFDRCKELEDIEKAIAYHARAVELTPDGRVDKSTWLNNLGLSCQARFTQLGELSDLDKSIAYLSQAVELNPEGRADRPAWLCNLGGSYMLRMQTLGKVADIQSANMSFRLAAQLPTSLPAIQFQSARQWAKCSVWLGESPKLGYQAAMELVPKLAWIGATIERRYETLLKIGDVAMEAAAWAISVQAYDLGFEWLEEGRSIVWNQILQLRTAFDDLSAVDSTLAQSLEQTARELELAGSRSTPLSPSSKATLDMEQEAQRHRQLASHWEQLLVKVRSMDGFHNFMRPHKINELRLVASTGPVVHINVHSSRCDALILQPNDTGIFHVPLHNFSKDKAVSIHAQLASLIGRQGTRSRGFKPAPYQVEIRKILSVLWSDVVKPILEFLGYTRKRPIEQLPHITWCTTGPLSFLPLHAAGCYDGLQPNAPDLVVSSFTPTLGALLSHTVQSLGSQSGLLAIGQQFSNTHGDLPSTVEELEAIKMHANADFFQKIEGGDATVDAVLDAMNKHSWVHLACHASQNSANPAHGAFHLHDGDLTLEAITKRSFKNKGLAFLSACQTATGDEKRPDESIHLAAGMMMAGYPSVIATMWSIYDIDGPEVAEQVYAELLKGGKMDCTRAARALHKAVARLREKVGEDSFKRWVPFIHIGVSA